jgi:Zn-dependent metalloprotease
MPKAIRRACATAIATLLILLGPGRVVAQRHDGLLSISAVPTLSGSQVREWDAFVEQMIRADELVFRAAYADRAVPGRRHERLSQFYRGIPVHGGDVSRQTASGVTVSVFGVVYTQIDIDLTATLSVDDARAIFENVSGTTPVRGGNPVLTILPTLDGRYALTYLATMQNAHTYFVDAHTGHVLRATDERMTESEVGSGRGVLGDVKKVSVNRVAGTFRTQDQLRPAEILTLDTRGSGASLGRMINGLSFDSDIATDSDNTWTDAGVVDAHVHIGWTYDYFLQRHGWAGLDGQDSRIFDAVNEFSVLPNNAFFIRAPFGPEGRGFMAFGADAQETPFTVLDVAAHEFMHGVTSFSAGLQSRLVLEGLGPTSIVLDSGVLDCDSTGVEFTVEGFLPFWCSDGKFVLTSRQGGAINEAFSDVFGAAVEFFIQEPGSGALQADYLTGEDLPGGAIRRLDSPQSLPILDPVRYPDHFSRRLTFPILIVEGTQESPIRIRLYPLIFLDDQGNFLLLRSTDNGGVHWNATILGHAFYLAIEGGQNATSGLSVAGVGATNREQIEDVFFRAMTTLMPRFADFPITAAVLRQSARDLFGVNSSVSRAVDQALLAVGL